MVRSGALAVLSLLVVSLAGCGETAVHRGGPATTPAASAPPAAKPATANLQRIGHIVVVFQDNRSFDNLYGAFPGADNIANAGAAATQVDLQGRPFTQLPTVMDIGANGAVPDTRFPPNLPNAPFDIGTYVPPDQKTSDLTNRFYQEQQQIDGGRMDKFAAVSNAGGLTMGHYDGSQLPLWPYAKRYVLADNFYHAAFGGSMLNHLWLVCACTPRFENPPPDLVAVVDSSGKLVKDGAVTPDGYVINLVQPRAQPHAPDRSPAKLLPPLTLPTIGDQLSDKGIDWAWYSGGWDDAIAGHPDDKFQFYHQPFAYFARYGDGTPDRAQHLRDESRLLGDIAAGTLPPVAFVKPIGGLNEHPGYADVMSGQRHVVEILQAIEKSPIWQDTVVIVTYGENGGFWDHVAPPRIDRWGPGTRVPAIIVSPLAKAGTVDHTHYDTTSILKLIEERWGLAPLGSRDAAAASLANALAL
jgi:phospholipase C